MRNFLAFLTVALLYAVPAFATKTPSPVVKSDPPSICDAITGNLVKNCGFETGDLTSWIMGGNIGFISVFAGVENSATFGAALGPVGSDGTLSQTLTTVAGDIYNFAFYLDNSQAAGPPSDFSASWDGSVLYTVTNPAAFSYTLFSFTVTGTGSDTINFRARNDPSFFFLDDVSVVGSGSHGGVPVPEPTSLLLLGTGLFSAVTLCRLRGNRFLRRADRKN